MPATNHLAGHRVDGPEGDKDCHAWLKPVRQMTRPNVDLRVTIQSPKLNLLMPHEGNVARVSDSFKKETTRRVVLLWPATHARMYIVGIHALLFHGDSGEE